MTKQEFIKKYCWAPESAADCHQITWDLMEQITDYLQDAENGAETEMAVGAAIYDIEILLEVIDKETPDYVFLKEVRYKLDEVK